MIQSLLHNRCPIAVVLAYVNVTKCQYQRLQLSPVILENLLKVLEHLKLLQYSLMKKIMCQFLVCYHYT